MFMGYEIYALESLDAFDYGYESGYTSVYNDNGITNNFAFGSVEWAAFELGYNCGRQDAH